MQPLQVVNRTRGDAAAFVLHWDGTVPAALHVQAGPDVHAPGIQLILSRFGRWSGVIVDPPVSTGQAILVEAHDAGGQGLAPRRAGFLADGVLRTTDLEQRFLVALEADSLRRIDDGIDRERHAAGFFRDLDCQTSPTLLLARHTCLAATMGLTRPHLHYRMEAVSSVLDTLSARLRERHRTTAPHAVRAPRDGGTDPLARTRAAVQRIPFDRTAVAYCAALQRAILSRWFPGCERSGGPRDALATAFAWFSTGRLALAPAHTGRGFRHVPFNTGAPDSTAIHCFAEFAFLAMEADIDRAFWHALLPILVSAPRLHHAAYGSPGAARSHAYYRAVGPAPRHPLDDAALGALVRTLPGYGARGLDRDVDALERFAGRSLAETVTGMG